MDTQVAVCLVWLQVPVPIKLVPYTRNAMLAMYNAGFTAGTFQLQHVQSARVKVAPVEPCFKQALCIENYLENGRRMNGRVA
jgi:hypothetical protein